MMRQGILAAFLLIWAAAGASAPNAWKADMGDGSYRNPVIHADYSDPDVCRAGEDYYMVASSFNCIPGLPILHSRDLVNWTLVGHALREQVPSLLYSEVQHGKGVWAPCIKYHKGEFLIYWGDPDFGIYMVRSTRPDKGWSEPLLIMAGKGMIDPSPLWDDDGRAYLVYAWAASRSGFNSVLTVVEMNAEGTAVISDPVMVFDGNYNENHTVEGPKFYKREGYYYIFAPAGGVAAGWQLAMRSKSVYGPYEWRKVMAQGKASINGPHQGAWVETPAGESWFINFQDMEAYGRVIHLNPMQWKEGWPVIGVDADGDGCGEPVARYRKPKTTGVEAPAAPAESDEFNDPALGLQWQWQANYQQVFGYPAGEYYRLNAFNLGPGTANLFPVPNMLLQKFPAEEFSAVAKLRFTPKQEGDRAGLIVMGLDYAYAGLVYRDGKVGVGVGICADAELGGTERFDQAAVIDVQKEFYTNNIVRVYLDIFLKVEVTKGGICRFSYSLDGKKFVSLPGTFTASPGKWIGAKTGVFCVTDAPREKCWVDIDWFRVKGK